MKRKTGYNIMYINDRRYFDTYACVKSYPTVCLSYVSSRSFTLFAFAFSSTSSRSQNCGFLTKTVSKGRFMKTINNSVDTIYTIALLESMVDL